MSCPNLEEVAAVYRHAYANGNAPTRAVAAHFNRPRSTAGRWVQEARASGHLGPPRGTTSGEADQPRYSFVDRATDEELADVLESPHPQPFAVIRAIVLELAEYRKAAPMGSAWQSVERSREDR